MYSFDSVVRIEKRLAPFVDLNGKMVIEIENIATGKAKVYVTLKTNVAPDMLDVAGVVALQADFSNASSGQFAEPVPMESQQPERRVALPHVENEYDSIRDRIANPLDQPVSTLFIGGLTNPMPTPAMEKVAQTTPVERRPNPQQNISRQPLSPPIPANPIPQQFTQQQLVPQSPLPPAPSQVNPQAQQLVTTLETREDPQVSIMQKNMEAMMQQMKIMQEMIAGKTGATEVVVPSEKKAPAKKVETIITEEEFYATLDRIKDEMPNFDPTSRLTREQCQQLEKYRLPKPVYVVSTVGQLFINDVGITIRQSTAANLASVPVYKLKMSSDLRQSFNNGRLKFVTHEMATKMSESAGIHAAIEGVESGLKAFVGADGRGIEKAAQIETDVTGTVDDEPISSRDIVARASRRQSATIEDIDESIVDEQSSLIDLTGDGDIGERSEAMIASEQSRARAKINVKHKEISRLDD